jgi:hypothetical protein
LDPWILFTLFLARIVHVWAIPADFRPLDIALTDGLLGPNRLFDGVGVLASGWILYG